MARRASLLRSKLYETTRNVIVDALVAQLLDTGAMDLTYFALARRSGVSVRTIYRHFPTRDDLLDELARRVNAVMNLKEYPKSREATVSLVRTLHLIFERNAPIIAALIQTGGRLRAKARKKRADVVQDVFAAAMPNLIGERRRAAAGIINVLLSSSTWARLRDEVGLDGTQSGDITAWAIDTLWRALEAEDRKSRS